MKPSNWLIHLVRCPETESPLHRLEEGEKAFWEKLAHEEQLIDGLGQKVDALPCPSWVNAEGTRLYPVRDQILQLDRSQSIRAR